MPAIRIKVFRKRTGHRSETKDCPSPATAQPPGRPGGSSPPIRSATTDSLDSLNEHLRLLRLASRGAADDPHVQPPTYLEATAEPDPEQASPFKPGTEKGPDTTMSPPCNSGFIDPTVDEAGAEKQLLDVATAFIPPPPSRPAPQAQASSLPPQTVTATSDASNAGQPQLIKLETQPLPEPEARFPRLHRPVLIPRIAPGATMPFIRALAPSLLDSHAIDEATFLAFVDHLNILCNPTAAVQAVQVASALLSVVPLDFADGVAALLQLACELTSHVIARRRCSAYLERVNAAFFAPRRLHARVVSTKEVRRVLELAEDDQFVVPLSRETVELTCAERCRSGLEARGAARLETQGLALPGHETALLARLAAWQVRYKLRRFEKDARSSRKRALKKLEKGKKVKPAGWTERRYIKRLSWVLISDLDDWEKVVEEKAKAKAEKANKKRQQAAHGSRKAFKDMHRECDSKRT